MQLIRYQDTELKTRGINHRVGSFRYKDLGEGVPGTAGNFFLRLVWSQTDFFSPRHLHNFDQVRVQIEGEFDFATDGTMKLGTIAYFPEGSPYGPQTSQDETIQLVMQIGGPSGAGYMSEAQRVVAVDALAKIGRFSEGRYLAPGDKGTTGIDSLQVAWEYALGKKMTYPLARFQKPVLMNPEALQWRPVIGHPATGKAQQRSVWDFGANAVSVVVYQLAAGASLTLTGMSSCFVEHGSGDVVDKAYAFRDVAHLAANENARFTATEDTRLLVFVHPVFAVLIPAAVQAARDTTTRAEALT